MTDATDLASLPRRPFGQTGLRVTPICLGCAPLASMPNIYCYTLLERSANPLIDLSTSRGMAVLNVAPYGGGMLAKGPDRWAKYAYREAPPDMVERVRQIDQICQQYDVPLAAALQFSLRDPRITSTIVGMTRPERLAQTVTLARHAIPDDLWSQLEVIQSILNLPASEVQ
jgi:D-threo-aldose 1-dehydrogenase